MAAKNHYCVRVYSNGEAKHTVRDADGLAVWLEYNRQYRWGNTLFVDGKLASPQDLGYLKPVRIKHIEALLQAELARGAHDLAKPAPFGKQTDFIGGKPYPYMGYAAEFSRPRFDFPRSS